MTSHGLIETLRCVRGAPLDVGLHEARLHRSWRSFFAPPAPQLAPLIEEALRSTRSASAGSASESGLLRLAFTEEAGGRLRVESSLRPLDAPSERIAVAVARAPRRDPIEARIHKQLAREWVDEQLVPGCFETLTFSGAEGLLEGTRTNVFLLDDGLLRTPPASAGLVAGIVRARVLELAPRLGFVVAVAPIPIGSVERAEGVLLTGSGIGVAAVSSCDGRGCGSERAFALARALRDAVAVDSARLGGENGAPC